MGKNKKPRQELKPRQRRYVAERLSGKHKSKRDAARAAGYSESVANCASRKIESPAVREEFQRLVQAVAPPEKVAQRIAEGLDAEETKFFQHEGEVTATRNVVAWEERRKYAELAAAYGGYYVPKQELKVTDGDGVDGGSRLAELLARAAERAAATPNAGGTARS